MSWACCRRCKSFSESTENWLLTCCECRLKWHHRCLKPPMTAEELKRLLDASNKREIDDSLFDWTCAACKPPPKIPETVPVVQKRNSHALRVQPVVLFDLTLSDDEDDLPRSSQTRPNATEDRKAPIPTPEPRPRPVESRSHASSSQTQIQFPITPLQTPPISKSAHIDRRRSPWDYTASFIRLPVDGDEPMEDAQAPSSNYSGQIALDTPLRPSALKPTETELSQVMSRLSTLLLNPVEHHTKQERVDWRESSPFYCNYTSGDPIHPPVWVRIAEARRGEVRHRPRKGVTRPTQASLRKDMSFVHII